MPSDSTNSHIEPPTFRPEEFYPVFARLPKVGDAVICGGQAVHLLCDMFLSEEEHAEILGEGGSATSTDMDIIMSVELQRNIESHPTDNSRKFALKRFADARQPISFAILPDDMPETRIDVLRTIKGIHIEKDRVFEDAVMTDAPYKVMNPVTLMIAKAENCASLEQNSSSGARNDVLHLKLLVLVVKNYLTEFVELCDPASKEPQRVIINQLKKLQKAAGTPGFIKGFEIAGVRLRDAIPSKAIEDSQLETLKSYFESTFLPGLSGKKSPRGDPSPQKPPGGL